jgi:hypothetical protein
VNASPSRADFIITAIIIILIGLWFYYSDGGRTQVAGWESLSSCSELVSLDSSKELSLFDDNRVRLNDKDGTTGDHYVWGSWSYDEASKRYTIAVNDSTSTYLAVSVPNTAIACILAAGDLNATDLRASWFASDGN